MLKQLIKFMIEQEQWELDDIDIADIFWFCHQFPQVSPIIDGDDKQLNELELSQKNQPNNIDIKQEQEIPSIPTRQERKNSEESETHYPLTPKSPKQTPIQVPDTGLINNTLELSRKARPLKQKVDSRIDRELDIKETVRISAELSTPLYPVYFPITKPTKERRLDLVLIQEKSKSMILWQGLLPEVYNFCQRLGAFRDIKMYEMEQRQKGVYIYPLHCPEKPITPKQLIDSSQKRLILILSDCLSEAWYQGSYTKVLQEWAKKGLLTVLTPFPESFWSRTALDYFIKIRLGNNDQTSPTQKWEAIPLSPWQMAEIDPKTCVKLPILNLETESFAAYVNVISGIDTSLSAGIWLEQNCDFKANLPKNRTPDQEINQFYATSSKEAWQLVQYLSAIPVSLSTIRLVRFLVPNATQVNVAEVVMGNLLMPVSSYSSDMTGKDIHFQFKEGVREELLKQILAASGQYYEELGKYGFQLSVIRKIGGKLAERFGMALDKFEASLLHQPLDFANHKDRELIEAFATVTATTFRKCGGVYMEYARKLEQSLVKLTFIDFSPLTVTVKELEINDESSAELLKELSFETVFVDKMGNITDTRQGNAYYFEEPLGEDVEPLTMISIPAGEFMMGSPEDEKGRYEDESPQHRVKVSPFFMSQTPITQAQWRAVSQTPKILRDLKINPSSFNGDDLPVEYVSWYDAIEFCARLSVYTGRSYRLPSEAEWEYACRGSQKSKVKSQKEELSTSVSEELTIDKWNEKYNQPFHFGETITSELANYDGTETYAGEPKGEYRQKTTKVRSFKPNAFGLYDMHGNVWEWCLDPWHDNYENAPNDSRVWDDELTEEIYNDIANNARILLDKDNRRIIKGGSWSYEPRNCRSAYRNDDDPRSDDDGLGLRVVCAVSGL